MIFAQPGAHHMLVKATQQITGRQYMKTCCRGAARHIIGGQSTAEHNTVREHSKSPGGSRFTDKHNSEREHNISPGQQGCCKVTAEHITGGQHNKAHYQVGGLGTEHNNNGIRVTVVHSPGKEGNISTSQGAA
jgi:hypothetical protein